MKPNRTKLLVAAVGALIVGVSGTMPTQPNFHVAQFGEMTKTRATPVPQRTAAPGTGQNVERRGTTQQQGSPFGGMQK